MNTALTLYDVRAVAARAQSLGSSHWVTLEIANGRKSRAELTMFVDTRDMADALANAVNYANASASVQTNHDKRLSDAAVQEYRDMVVALPEGV
jgi:hypothetical protein